METVWNVKPRTHKDIILQLLDNRKVDLKEKDEFFNPNFKTGVFDPYLLSGMKKIVSRIETARKKQETVGIFSDYDADGIPAAALLKKTFSQLGMKSIVYIPNRESGYGLSNEGVDFLISKKCSLIITADLGIRSIAEAKYCQEKKIDLIITDHHIPGDQTPDAYAIINPKAKGNKYPFKELCGCGVAYKIVDALSKVYPKEINEQFLKWNLDLVAISTIADVVPLTGENRVFAFYGLKVIRKTKNIGLKKLIEVSKIKQEEATAYHIGFQIGPRINAPGRLDHATKSYELLITEDKKQAEELANWLDQKNEERQQSMEKVEKAAVLKIFDEELDKNKIIVVAGRWLKGVIGPTASRLVEKFCRPVILFSESDNLYVGSARSVEGVNIVNIFENISSSINKFGGHKGAAGLSVTNFKKFFKSIVEYANKSIDEKLLCKKINIDAQISPSEISKGLCHSISLFEPFGMGNARPVFMAKDVLVISKREIGPKKNHLSMVLKYGDRNYRSVLFNHLERAEEPQSNNLYDIVFYLELNNWNGSSNININLIDLKPAAMGNKTN